MSIKYKKWRELLIDPLYVKYKNFELINIVSYPPAQNDVIEGVAKIKNQNQEIFIKIERSKMSDLFIENKHLNILKNHEYYSNIPEVIEYGSIEDKKYIALEKIEGRRLSDIFKNKNINKKKYLIKYGKELAIIHKIPKKYFFNAKQRIINNIPNSGVYKKIDDCLDLYLKYLNETKILFDTETFIHGDFHYANVLWKSGKINGVLDWEYSGKGFKEQDIAWACALRPTQKFMDTIEDIKTFLKGYSMVGDYDGKKLKWCLINAYLHFYIMNDTNEEYKNKLKNLMNKIYNMEFNMK